MGTVSGGRRTDTTDGTAGMAKAPAAADAPPEVTAERVAAWLRANPDFLARNPALLTELTPPARAMGRNVVDLQHLMVRRLQENVAALEAQRRSLIAGGRAQRTSQARAHKCVLALMSATSLQQLVHAVTTDLAVLWDVDVATLCVEADGAMRDKPPAGVRVLRGGTVEALFGGGRRVLLRDNVRASREIFGPGSRLVRSEALMRLKISRRTPPGLLALGSRRPDKFQPSQPTELLGFLARALEHNIRAWLNLPD